MASLASNNNMVCVCRLSGWACVRAYARKLNKAFKIFNVFGEIKINILEEWDFILHLITGLMSSDFCSIELLIGILT